MDEVEWLMANELPRLRRYALALTNDHHAADDLVQDCVERAIRKRHQWRRRGSMRSWLFRILYRLFLNEASRRSRLKSGVPLDDVAERIGRAADQDTELECADITDAMARLPANQRAAIALTAVEGLSYDQAAEVLEVPIGTLRSRLSRGREQLRRLYPGRSASAERCSRAVAPLRRVK